MLWVIEKTSVETLAINIEISKWHTSTALWIPPFATDWKRCFENFRRSTTSRSHSISKSIWKMQQERLSIGITTCHVACLVATSVTCLPINASSFFCYPKEAMQTFISTGWSDYQKPINLTLSALRNTDGSESLSKALCTLLPLIRSMALKAGLPTSPKATLPRKCCIRQWIRPNVKRQVQQNCLLPNFKSEIDQSCIHQGSTWTCVDFCQKLNG